MAQGRCRTNRNAMYPLPKNTFLFSIGVLQALMFIKKVCFNLCPIPTLNKGKSSDYECVGNGTHFNSIDFIFNF